MFIVYIVQLTCSLTFKIKELSLFMLIDLCEAAGEQMSFLDIHLL